MRLPNGYGSVYRLSGNRRKPWIARKTIDWDENGKQLYHIIGYYKTKPEALAALAEYNKNPIGLRGDITLQEIYDEWRKSKFEKISAKTVRTYTVAWDNHLNKLKDMRVKDIKKSHLQNIIEGMIANKLSHSSCQKVKVLASLLFKQAMADDIVTQNYASLIELPRLAEKKKDNYFTDAEIKTIKDAAQEDEWASTVLILIYTGMRISEFLSLTKFSVDIDNMIITGGIKTDAGRNRVIPVHPKIKAHIQYWYNKPGTHLIQRNNKPILVDYYRKHIYYPTLEKINVRKLTPHATRHTFASLLARANASTKASQELLGHADYSTTANIYTHTDIRELEKAISKI